MSPSTLPLKWMVETGLWPSRKQHRTFRQARIRRERYGELIQIDGSEPRLSDILCHPEQRYVGAQLTFPYDSKQRSSWNAARLRRTSAASMSNSTTLLRTGHWMSDGKNSASYHAFSTDQRVRDTAIVENKRLGHALMVKAQQDLRNSPKVMTNSEKTGYQKRTRIGNAPLLVLSDALRLTLLPAVSA